MCESSVHVANRRATNRERLVLRKVFTRHGNDTGHMGFYPAHARCDDPKLVCIRQPTEFTSVSDVNLNRRHWQGHFKPSDRSKVEAAVQNFKKAKFLPAGSFAFHARSIKFWENFQYCDSLVIDDNMRLPLFLFEEGLTAEIGERPVRKPRITGKKGMKVVKAALREAAMLPPEPKPEEGEQPAPETPAETAPAPQPEPVPDVPPTPTAARRRHVRA